jgi:hypothetical protein
VNDPLQFHVLVECKVAGHLFAVSHGSDEAIAIDGGKTIQESDSLFVPPDDVVGRQGRIVLQQPADETPLSYFLKIGIEVELLSGWLKQYTGCSQGCRHDLPVARRVSLQPPLLVGFKTPVIEDDES